MPTLPECSRSSASRGVAAVEMAFVLPLFLILIMACGELGRAAYQYNTLTKAVRDGAQYAARNMLLPATGVVSLGSGTIASTRNLVVFGNPGGTGAPVLPGLAVGNVSVTVSGTADPAHVTVTAVYTYSALFAHIPGLGLGGNVTPPGSFTASSSARSQ